MSGDRPPPLSSEVLAIALDALNRTVSESPDPALMMAHCIELHARIGDTLDQRSKRGHLTEGDLRLIRVTLSALRLILEAGIDGYRFGVVAGPIESKN